MRRPELDKFLHRIAHEVEEIPEARLRALAPAMKAAMSELKAELAAVIGDGKEHRFTAQNIRRALIQLHPAMEKLNELHPEMVKQLTDGHRAAEALAHQHLVETFRFFMNEGRDGYNFDKSLFPIPIRQAARVAEAALVDHYKASVARYTDGVRRDIRLQLAKSLVKGETPFQMRNRLAPKIAHAVPAGDAVGEALTRKYNFWAERIVRTELNHAYNTQALEEGKQLAREEPDEWLSEWNAVLDLRVCIDCRETDGARVPVGAVFPIVNCTRPPAHPLCRCIVLSVRRDWAE